MTHVRSATPADVDAISRICADGFRLTAHGLLDADVIEERVTLYYRRKRLRDELGPAGRGWLGYLVAEQDGVVAGTAGGGMVDDETGQLYVLYLGLDCRGRGIGTLLLDAVTDQQRALGATRQRVSVLADNVHGVPFYRARGFVEFGRRGYPEDAPKVEELLMERPL